MLATQKDLKILSLEMNASMVSLELRLEIKINHMATRLILILGSMIVAGFGILGTMVIVFSKGN